MPTSDDSSASPPTGRVVVRQAEARDATAVCAVLTEAARWIDARGMTMWRDDELAAEAIVDDVAQGLFHVADVDGEIAGVVKFQLKDDLFWPDVPHDDSAFIHRLAVRRPFAATGVSVALIEWAAARAAASGRRWLRLDCEASRIKLRTFYERHGFVHHSDRRVGPYFVSRYERAIS